MEKPPVLSVTTACAPTARGGHRPGEGRETGCRVRLLPAAAELWPAAAELWPAAAELWPAAAGPWCSGMAGTVPASSRVLGEAFQGVKP